MTLQELKRLVAKGESNRLEFKRTTGQRTDAAKTVCAMLNGLGGFVVFGVGDKGELVGQEIGQRTVEEVTNELSRIDPPAFPEVETIALAAGRSFIVLRVPGSSGLFNFDGRYYVRVGPTTRPMPRHEYERRLVERLHGTRRWENEPVPDNVTIADLDADEIRSALENAVSLGRLNAPKNRGIKAILQDFELFQDGQLLNAAVALFGKSPRLHGLYPQLGIRLARFRGVNRLADFTDNRQYWGHAFDLLRRGEAFLHDHVPIAGRVVEGKMRREDRPAYPPRATSSSALLILKRPYSFSQPILRSAFCSYKIRSTSVVFSLVLRTGPFGMLFAFRASFSVQLEARAQLSACQLQVGS
jgi:ATP-dependent DNA helicase RecG